MAPCKNSEKSKDPNPKNTESDVRQEGWPEHISQAPSSYRQVSNKYSCTRLRFKIQDIEYDVGLTKDYCITSKKKNCSIHKLTQKILATHVLNGHAYF